MADDGDLFDTVKQEQPGSVWSGCIHELLIPDQHGASCLNFMVMNIWIVRLCGCLAQHSRGPGDEGILFLCELLKYILKLVFDFGALTNITYKLIRRGIVNCNNSTESVGYKNRKERLVDDLVLDEVDMKFLKMIDNTSHHIAHYQTTFYNQWTSKVMGKLSPNTSTILLSEFSLIIGSTQCFTIDILITLDISTFILFVLFHCFIEVCMKGRNFNWVLTKILIISHYIIRTLGPGSVDSGGGQWQWLRPRSTRGTGDRWQSVSGAPACRQQPAPWSRWCWPAAASTPGIPAPARTASDTWHQGEWLSI